jgi:CheY-like chemotaxis protein
LNSFSNILSKRGFQVETAETGKQALEKIKQGFFDLSFD